MSELCYIDTETTGLDARIHEPYELSWWLESAPAPHTMRLPHSLENADPKALEIGGYWERMKGPWDAHEGADRRIRARVARALQGVTLVGSNPAFDAAMLTRFIGTAVWYHHPINVGEGAMWVFGWDRPKSLGAVADACRDRGFDIPVPDHTAEADVRTTRAVHEALRTLRGRLEERAA